MSRSTSPVMTITDATSLIAFHHRPAVNGTRHVQVEQDNVRLIPLHHPERAGGGPGVEHPVALILEVATEEMTNCRIIIDNEYARPIHRQHG